MRTTRLAIATALVAVAGLVVSVTTAWSAYSSGPQVQESPEPAVAARAAGPVLVDPPAAPAVRDAEPVTRLSTFPPRVRRSDASPAAAPRDRRPPRPERLRLGSVGIDAPVRPVGVRRDGQMQLPADPDVLGWYRFGPVPREGRGAVVVAGHLDSRRFGIGPLADLREAKAGDTIRVASPDGRTTAYVVRQIRRFDRQRLPDQLFSRTGPERLHLITCGGAFDSRNGYELNLVVTAVPKR